MQPKVTMGNVDGKTNKKMPMGSGFFGDVKTTEEGFDILHFK